jgi:hypothetical protein
MYGIGALTSEFLIGDSTIHYMTHYTIKPGRIRNKVLFGCAIVKPEYLFIDIAKKVEWFDAYVRAFQSALEQAPEVFQSVRVGLPIHMAFRMVNNLMGEVLMGQPLIGEQRIGVDRALCRVPHSSRFLR